MELSLQSREAVAAFAAANAKGQHGEHAYTAKEYGLSEDVLRVIYRDYCQRFGLSQALTQTGKPA
jgi:hypothetical protein